MLMFFILNILPVSLCPLYFSGKQNCNNQLENIVLHYRRSLEPNDLWINSYMLHREVSLDLSFVCACMYIFNIVDIPLKFLAIY